MNIFKFKLIDDGDGGIEVTGQEFFASAENFAIVDNVSRKRKIILNYELIETIKKLRYAFLNICGYWIGPYDKYYDNVNHKPVELGEDPKPAHITMRNLLNRTHIIGAIYKGGQFKLIGKIEVLNDKFMPVTTPFVSEDDDFELFNDTIDILEEVSKQIVNYFKKGVVPIEKMKEKVPLEQRNGKTEEEIGDIALKYMQDRGAIIMMQDDSTLEELDSPNFEDAKHAEDEDEHNDGKKMEEEKSESGDNPVTLSEPEPEPELADDTIPEGFNVEDESYEDFNDNEPLSEPEKVNPFGPPASKLPGEEQENRADNGDISDYEFSENI